MLKIGETISRLRRDRNITQEMFAEMMGVSSPAVSKWETGQSYPDIELLPKMAGFFRVSVDRLLSYEIPDVDSDVAEILATSNELFGNNQSKEAIALLTDAAYRHPNNHEVKLNLGRYKVYYGANLIGDAKIKMLTEALDVLSKVAIRDLPRQVVDEANSLIAQAHTFLGNYKKALSTIEAIKPSQKVQPNNQIATIYTQWGRIEDATRTIQENLYENLTNIITNVSWMSWAQRSEPEFAIKYGMLAIRVIEAFSEGMASHLDKELSYRYEAVAWGYTKLGDVDEALTYLRKAAEAIVRFDQLSDKRTNDITFFDRLGQGNVLWHTDKDQSRYLLRVLYMDDERPEYKALRERPEFREIVSMLEV